MEDEEIVRDDHQERRLSNEEIRNLRKLLEQDTRIKWFWSTARTWLLMISALIAFLTVGFDGIRTVLRRLVE
jgi:hypothetical protein